MEIILDIAGLTFSPSQKDAYILVLSERNGDRKIPILIGSHEAQAIAIEMEHMQSPRPLTHDLFKTLGDKMGFSVSNIFINKLDDGIFYSQLTIVQGDKTYHVDCRTSDAVAIALRFKCDIFTTEDIIARSSISASDNDKELDDINDSMSEEELEQEEKRLEFIFDSKEELESKLSKAIEIEDFETASLIRDELRSRENPNE